MAISEQQKQKKLLKKKQKKAAIVKVAKSFLSVSAASCVAYPVHECVIPDNLFDIGLGEVFVTRRLPNGQLAISAFVVDVFCLGVKNAFFRVGTEEEYEQMKLKVSGHDRDFERIHQSCAKKLIDGAVDYAKNLGFSSHADYKKAAALLGNIDAAVCPVHYEYGKDGKPFYIRGPYESLTEYQRIVATLHNKCGADGFKSLFLEG